MSPQPHEVEDSWFEDSWGGGRRLMLGQERLPLMLQVIGYSLFE